MTEQKPTQRVLSDRNENSEELKMMAKALEEMHLSLEPVRDQALDRKAFFTGYAQCAEDMIKAIMAKMVFLKNQAQKKEEEVKDAEEIQKENGKSRRRAKIDSPA